MIPEKPLPCSDEFASADDYVEALLAFTTRSEMFRFLCGGIHILDFWISEPGHFHHVFPADWRPFLAGCPPLTLMDLLIRTDLDGPLPASLPSAPPMSLLQYVRSVRRLCLGRDFVSSARPPRLPVLSRNLALGMNAKKKHEVLAFAGYLDRLVEDVRGAPDGPADITHLVDFGSGKNYLGRVLASDPYCHRVVALESRGGNILGAQKIDAMAGVAERNAVHRNKKAWLQIQIDQLPADKVNAKLASRIHKMRGKEEPVAVDNNNNNNNNNNNDEKVVAQASADFRPVEELEVKYEEMEEGKGSIQYIEGRLEHGDLSRVIPTIKSLEQGRPLNLMGVSLHSCGNLTNHAIRSLVLNPEIRAVAIVGCCYNQVTERLGPPTQQLAGTRPWNGRRRRKQLDSPDPHGFPMSEKFATYGGGSGSGSGSGSSDGNKDGERGVRVNVTARMMACHAPLNWNEESGERSFSRHYYRSLLQRILIDRGVVRKVYDDNEMDLAAPFSTPHHIVSPDAHDNTTPFNTTNNPVNLGALPATSYVNFTAYVRGAMVKMTTSPEFGQHAADVVSRKMAGLTDDEIAGYEARFGPRKTELSSAWSLMAFSGQLVEALMVVDRWRFLREQQGIGRCWVETVFDYQQSPRNLVVVGVKR